MKEGKDGRRAYAKHLSQSPATEIEEGKDVWASFFMMGKRQDKRKELT